MSNAEAVQQQMQALTRARSETGVFVRMAGRFAVVNVGRATVPMPCIGFYPPVVGMSVRVDWVNGSPAVTGPVRPLNPLGVITATGTPRATVTVDEVTYTLFYRDGYVPTVGDQVEINWATGVIQGKVTGVESPNAPVESGGGSTAFSVTVRAADSGRYQNSWWGKGPWASKNNDGIWTYGNRVRDAVAGGDVSRLDIYLPLISELGNASIGTHPHSSIPAGAPSISSLTPLPLGGRSGWVRLPKSFGDYLAAGGRGIGVHAPGGGGWTQWRGVDQDSLSGALRISGTR